VCSIPLAVGANESLPLAIILWISGSKEVSEMFCHVMRTVGVSQADLDSKSVPDGEHSSVIAI
jgi:hypothetical protein